MGFYLNRIAEEKKPKTEGQIFAVGIAYKKKSKVHRCRIEVLKPA